MGNWIGQPRPYDRSVETHGWALQAVFDYLATFRFQCKVEVNGRITLLKRECSVGQAFQRRTVAVQMDAHARKGLSVTIMVLNSSA